MTLEVDRKFIVIKHLIEHAEEIARGSCFYPESLDELFESIDYLRDSLEICRVERNSPAPTMQKTVCKN